MAAPKRLRNAVGVSEDIDESQFIGRLAMFTLPNEERNGADLVRAWAKHGLDAGDLPEARQPVHIFQSACASVRSRRGVSNGHDAKVEVRSDEVSNTPGECSYQITVAVWDLSRKMIEHEKAMRVRFDKYTSALEFDELDSYDATMGKVEKEIRAHFKKNAKTVPGQKVRNAVRLTLLKVGAQNMRRKAGGVYFVPVRWQPNGQQEPTKPTLDGLAGVLDELYGDRADFHTVPLVSSDAQKAMVRKHFALNVAERSEELAQKAFQRVRQGKGRGVRNDLLTNLYNERRKLHGSIEQFDDLVGVERKQLAENLGDLDSALAELQELADQPG